jgi:hypothetical protein
MSAQNDIVLFSTQTFSTTDYIREMVIRSSIIQMQHLLALKRTFNLRTKLTLSQKLKGLKLPKSIDDWRVMTYIKKGKRAILLRNQVVLRYPRRL